MPERPSPAMRNVFSHFEELSTRWNDNDIYAHMYNGVYYQLFDTAVHNFLIRKSLLNLSKSKGAFIMASNGCDFFSELAFPDKIFAGIKITRLGNSSISYKIALFRGDAQKSSATGRLVHVYIDKKNRRPVALPNHIRQALQPLI